MLYQLSYSRVPASDASVDTEERRRKKEWGVLDLNQRRRSRRVYSPLPLTTRATPRET